jgi:hypothetical protein
MVSLQLQLCFIMQELLGKRGVDWMKVNRTYSIDVDLVQALRSKRNQSNTVCRALRLYLAGEDQYDLAQEDSKRMLRYLRHRDDISEQLKAVIVAELAKGSE